MSRLPVIRLLTLGLLALGLFLTLASHGTVRAERAERIPPPESGVGVAQDSEREIPETNPYEDPSQCTHRAWELAARAGHRLPRWGNAAHWRARAIAAGYRVLDRPDPRAAGSVAVWAPGAGGASWAGHVGWVTRVDGDRFYVQDRNWTGGDSERWVDWVPGISFITFPRGELRIVEPMTLSHANPRAGERVGARFTVKNVGDAPVIVQALVAAGRRHNGDIADFPHAKDIVLPPGSELVYERWSTFESPGDYVTEPRALIDGQWVPLEGGSRISFAVGERPAEQAGATAMAPTLKLDREDTRSALAKDKGLALLLRLLNGTRNMQS